jgi:hypothetical protein
VANVEGATTPSLPSSDQQLPALWFYLSCLLVPLRDWAIQLGLGGTQSGATPSPPPPSLASALPFCQWLPARA